MHVIFLFGIIWWNITMSLIQELGGYDCAKEEYQDPKYEDDELYTIKATGTRFFKHQLAAELLEYRREHNIFDRGDWIKAKDYQFGFDELFRIDDFLVKEDGVHLAVLDDGDCYPLVFLEHATDAEIEAGRRLDD